MAVALQTQSYRLPMPRAAATDGIQPRQWQVLVEAIFPTAKTPEAVMLAWSYCKARGLDPFRRPVNIVPMWNSTLGKEVETVWEGINGIEANAAKTGQWAGMDPAKWGPDITDEWHGKSHKGQDLHATVTFPEWCEVTVYRIIGGQRCAFTETVYWLEAYASIGKSGVPNDMWCRRPRGQLHKCAKAAVLRTAFPEVAGYAAEEMEGRDIKGGGTVIDAQAEPVGHDPETGEVGQPAAQPETIPLVDATGKVAGNYNDPVNWLRGLDGLVKNMDEPDGVGLCLANKAELLRIESREDVGPKAKAKARELRLWADELAPAGDA